MVYHPSSRRLPGRLGFAAAWAVATAAPGYGQAPEHERSPASDHAAIVAPPVDVIFDTDIGNDIDDALALALLHALESRGECRLLAVTITKDHPLAAAFTDAVNRFYGRGEVPIGVVRDGKTPEQGSYLGVALQQDGDTLRHPRALSDGGDAPDAVTLLRRTLAGRPDGSVVIVQVGFSTNLARLLDTSPDEVSPLSGRDLVARKVQRLSVMAGAFAPVDGATGYREYNVVTDLPAARMLAAEWPTPVVWSGFEVGLAMPFPGTSIEHDYRWADRHPVVEAYRRYQRMPYDRPTWDLTSVLEAVRPQRGYFTLSPPGRVIVEADGATRFEEASDGPHRFLLADPLQAARAVEAFVTLCSEPTRGD
jgi:inosine-uridine nucleoside N-ribohydrolase